MPVLRLNAAPRGLALHGSPANAHAALCHAARGSGPIIVMIHGFKYQPGHPRHCPHASLFATQKACRMRWPRHLGFRGDVDEGLALAFGWAARGTLWEVAARARQAGVQLAEAIALLRRAAPDRPVHLITHSMGSEVAFEALHHLPARAVGRVLTLTAASYQSRAAAALQTPAGRTAELLNITSGENDLFDFAFERLITAPVPGDRALGSGLAAANAVTLQIDCPSTLAALSGFSGPIASPRRRICHWSAYTRPGVLRFYRLAMRAPEQTPLTRLKSLVPGTRAPRFARLLPQVARPGGLPYPSAEAS